MRVCPRCAESTDESGRFCAACGAEMRSARVHTDPGLPGSEATADLVASPSSTLSLLGALVDNQFEVSAVIASGAFATVYRARQRGIDRDCALKVPTFEIASDPVQAKRFAREARAAARVRHPGVVTIYSVGEVPDGRPYLAMELVSGEPLTTILEGGVVAPTRALKIGRLIASALAETHAAGVIHRDLKPSNIIWQRDRTGDDRVTIVDFGIAVSKPGSSDATRLTAGGLIGTPHYMSPEQAHGEAVDGRADLYALGCILFELVTGSTLFDGSGYEIMLAHLGKVPPRARERVPSVPLALDALIWDLVAKRPEDRPASVDAVVVRIDDALADLDLVSDATRIRAPRAKRPTGATKRDLPEANRALFEGSTVAAPSVRDAPEMSGRRARWIVGIALGAVATAGAGVVIVKVLSGGDPTGRDVASPAVAVAPLGDRAYVKDDGETTLRMTLPDPLAVNAPITAHLQLWNKLGQPITDPPVLTIEDPHGAAKGFSAKRVGDGFEFRRTMHAPGRYLIRVFPAGTDSELDVEVEAR